MALELLSLEQADIIRDDPELRLIFDRMWQHELTQRAADARLSSTQKISDRAPIPMGQVFAAAQIEKADLLSYRATPRGLFTKARNNAEDLTRQVANALEALWSANQRGPSNIAAELPALNDLAARLQAEVILMNVHAKEMAR